MKPLAYGAVLALLWLLFGLPVTALAPLAQPVTLAFAAGILARPYLARGGWSR